MALEKLLNNIKSGDLSQFWIKVKSGASKNSLDGIISIDQKDYIKISVKAVRENGKANKMIISYLAEILEMPKNRIEIKTGHSASMKKIIIL